MEIQIPVYQITTPLNKFYYIVGNIKCRWGVIMSLEDDMKRIVIYIKLSIFINYNS